MNIKYHNISGFEYFLAWSQKQCRDTAHVFILCVKKIKSICVSQCRLSKMVLNNHNKDIQEKPIDPAIFWLLLTQGIKNKLGIIKLGDV